MIANGFWEDGKSGRSGNPGRIGQVARTGHNRCGWACPSCALIFRDDILRILPRACWCAAMRLEAARRCPRTFLMEMRGERTLILAASGMIPSSPLLHHAPCHLRAYRRITAEHENTREARPPGIKTCQCQCGMLRHFGRLWLQKEKYDYRARK